MNGPDDARFRIVSDGTGIGTHFLNEKTGENLRLAGVTAMRIEADAEGLVQVHLSFDAIKLDMVGVLSSLSSRPTPITPASPN